MHAKNTADILIKNAFIITLNGRMPFIPDGAMAIQGDSIVALGTTTELSSLEAREEIDARGRMLMPGLVNAHCHAAMTLFRGLADDMPLEPWLHKIWPLEMRFATPENVRLGSLLAFVEMIRGGITTVADMYWHAEETVAAARQAGIRLVNGVGIIDTIGESASLAQKERIVRDFVERYQGDPLIHPCVQFHSTYTVNRDSLLAMAHLAEIYHVPLITHASESRQEVQQVRERYGLTPIQYLESLGALHKGTTLVHCVHLTDEEIAILANRQVAVVHCPESNLKLGSGIARLPELLDAGVLVGLGTDGAASNNDLDLWGEMRTAALVHKGSHENPALVTAQQVLHMATLGSAGALGLDHLIGSLEVGKRADVILVDAHRPHLTPMYHPISHLVYAVHSDDVDTVIINGKVVMMNRTLLTVDVDALEDEVRKIALQIAQA